MTDFGPLGEPAPEGARVNMVWTRDTQDVATCGLHFVHANPGIMGDTIAWDDAADSTTIEGLLTTLWNGLKGQYAADIQLDRFDWHHFGVGIRRPNPKFRETVLGPAIAGTSVDDQMPEQIAVSVTLKTDKRKSWGRVYLPAPTVTFNDGGYVSAAGVGLYRTMFGDLLDGAAAASLPLVVWCPRHGGKLLKFSAAVHDSDPTSNHELGLDEPDTSSIARGVQQVQVDNVFDVIRRRRFKPATLRDTHTLGA